MLCSGDGGELVASPLGWSDNVGRIIQGKAERTESTARPIMSEAAEHKKEDDRKPLAAKTIRDPKKVYLVPYPKVVLLYPTLLMALVAAVALTFMGGDTFDPAARTPAALTAAFLVIFAVNLMVLTIDFPRGTSLTLFFVGSTLLLGVVLMTTLRPNFFPWLRDLAVGIHPVANATFFWVFSGIMTVIFVVVKITVQFDYWEVHRNEILHHHGFLSDLRRYPTQGMQVEKEINDVFEFLLMRSGRLILKPPGQNRWLVLDNLPFIDTKEKELTELLSSVEVNIKTNN